MFRTVTILSLFLTTVFGQEDAWRVISGSKATSTQFPWQASLRYGSSGYHKCGGIIIDAYTIVTAAHCFGSSKDPKMFKVAVGSNLKSKAVKHAVRSIRIHSGWTNFASSGNDITIMKLSSPIKMNSYTKAATLPSSSSDRVSAGNECIISGWGSQGNKEIHDRNYLLYAKVKVVDNVKCAKMMGHNKIGDYNLCAGGHDTRNACMGDSGGPLVCYSGSKGAFVLRGIVSWGDYPCGQVGKAGVYTRVSKYLDWIKRNKY